MEAEIASERSEILPIGGRNDCAIHGREEAAGSNIETAEDQEGPDVETLECTAASLRLLEGREHVRQRPAMYLGDTGSNGLHQLFVGILDDMIEEVFGGCVSAISVELSAPGALTVKDNGSGISARIDERTGVPHVVMALTLLNYYRSHQGPYRVPGFRPAFYSCVNFLSTWCEVQTRVEGRSYRIRYEQGHLTEALQDMGETADHGMTFSWLPDPEIFGDHQYDTEILKGLIRKTCYLTPEVTIRFHDHSSNSAPEEYHFERGVADLLASLNERRETVSDIIAVREVRNQVLVDVALQFTTSSIDTSHTFVNNVQTPAGGSHLDGLKLGVRRALGKYARENGLLPSGAKFANVDITYGLTAVIAIRHVHPQFEGATKAKLHNPEIVCPISQIVEDALMRHFEQYPDVAAIVLKRAVRTRQIRLRR